MPDIPLSPSCRSRYVTTEADNHTIIGPYHKKGVGLYIILTCTETVQSNWSSTVLMWAWTASRTPILVLSAWSSLRWRIGKTSDPLKSASSQSLWNLYPSLPCCKHSAWWGNAEDSSYISDWVSEERWYELTCCESWNSSEQKSSVNNQQKQSNTTWFSALERPQKISRHLWTNMNCIDVWLQVNHFGRAVGVNKTSDRCHFVDFMALPTAEGIDFRMILASIVNAYLNIARIYIHYCRFIIW